MALVRWRLWVLAGVLAVATIAGGWAVSRTQPDARAPLAVATEVLAPNTRVASFTNWREARAALGNPSLDTGARRQQFLDAARNQDLSYRSVLAEPAVAMYRLFAWAPFNLDWEIFGQADTGSIVVAGMGADLDVAEVEDQLDAAGYRQTGDIWSIDVDTYAAKAPGVTGLLQNVAMLDSDRLIIASDDLPYLRDAVERHRSNGRSLADERTVRGVLAPLHGSVSALIATAKDACEMASLADVSDSEKIRARNLVEPLGALAPIRRLGQGLIAGHGSKDGDAAQVVRYAMAFDSGVQAREQAWLRGQLTDGNIVGRVASYGDFMKFDSAHTDGNIALLDFDVPTPMDSALTQIGDAPFLPAACGLDEAPTPPIG